MVHVGQWAGQFAVGHALGVHADVLTDDRIARALDALAPVLEQVTGSVGAAAIAAYGIDVSQLHWDMTQGRPTRPARAIPELDPQDLWQAHHPKAHRRAGTEIPTLVRQHPPHTRTHQRTAGAVHQSHRRRRRLARPATTNMKPAHRPTAPHVRITGLAVPGSPAAERRRARGRGRPGDAARAPSAWPCVAPGCLRPPSHSRRHELATNPGNAGRGARDHDGAPCAPGAAVWTRQPCATNRHVTRRGGRPRGRRRVRCRRCWCRSS